VISELNRHFVCAYLANDDYYSKSAGAPPEERAELQRIREEGFARKLPVGDVRAYVLSPDGHTFDVVAGENATTTLASLGRAISQFRPQAGKPAVPPGPQSIPPPAAADTLTLHLIARGDDRGSWGEFPAENWIVLNRGDWSKLVPAAPVSPGQTWAFDPDVSARILTYFYPQTENNDARIDRIEQQSLTAKVLTVENDLVTARVDGFVKMLHAFYPGRKEAAPLEAQVVGVLTFVRGQPPTLTLVTTQAIHGTRPFKVAVWTIAHPPQ